MNGCRVVGNPTACMRGTWRKLQVRADRGGGPSTVDTVHSRDSISSVSASRVSKEAGEPGK